MVSKEFSLFTNHIKHYSCDAPCFSIQRSPSIWQNYAHRITENPAANMRRFVGTIWVLCPKGHGLTIYESRNILLSHAINCGKFMGRLPQTVDEIKNITGIPNPGNPKHL